MQTTESRAAASQTATPDLGQWAATVAELDDPKAIANKLLTLLRQMGLEGGIVYRALPRAACLIGFAGAPHEMWECRGSPYIFRFSDTSAATYAYDNGAKKWPSPDHSEINQQGRRDSNISGSLFAVPLGDKDRDAVFGSVCAWHKNRLSEPDLSYFFEGMIQAVNYATAPLRFAFAKQDAESRSRFQSLVGNVLQRMMQDGDLNANLDAILNGINNYGFTRARLYEFHSGYLFVGKMARGMGHFTKDEFRHDVPYWKNEYTKEVYHQVSAARQRSADFKPPDLLARVYPKNDKNGNPIHDSCAGPLNKPTGMPWGNVPIISAGKLYGLITADKLLDGCTSTQKPRWQEITDVDLDALDTFAQLASHAYVLDDMRGSLIQKNLRVLDQSVGLEQPLDLVKRRLLLFLTHGDQGLGFSRALFFSPDDSTNCTVHHFENGVGSIELDEFTSMCTNVREKSLAQVLHEADTNHDFKLNDAHRDLSIDSQEICRSMKEVDFYHSHDEFVPDIVHQFKALGWNHGFLVARLQAGGKELGLFVVDRKWDLLGLIDSDQDVLLSFTRYAAKTLFQHVSLSERVKDIEHFGGGLVHEYRKGLGLVLDASDKIERPGTLAGLISGATELQLRIEQLRETVNSFDTVFSRSYTRTPEQISHIVTMVTQIVSSKYRNPCVSVCAHGEQVEDWIRVHLGAICIAVENLVRNAYESIEREFRNNPNYGNRKIRISTFKADGFVRISVEDDGPGVSPQILEQLRKPFPSHTLKHKDSGTGLSIAKWVVLKHQGTVDLYSEEGYGFTATISLPMN